MPNPSILISIETLIKTEDKSFGRNFMESLMKEDRRLTPELLSTSEKFKNKFTNIENFIDEWWAMPTKSYFDGRFESDYFRGPHWKRKSTLACQGYVNHGFLNKNGYHMPSKLWFKSRWCEDVRFFHLFKGWVELAKPMIGMAHLFSDPERVSFRQEGDVWFETGSFGGRAKPGIPNIGWCMAYGERYASEVDVTRIRNAGFLIDIVGDIIIVRVTESLSDVINDFEYFDTRRSELKRLFRPDLFWI